MFVFPTILTGAQDQARRRKCFLKSQPDSLLSLIVESQPAFPFIGVETAVVSGDE
jgi:hypothetical protein